MTKTDGRDEMGVGEGRVLQFQFKLGRLYVKYLTNILRSCMIQHLQRAGNQQLSLFESFWYIVVTFSTVGYGGK